MKYWLIRTIICIITALMIYHGCQSNVRNACEECPTTDSLKYWIRNSDSLQVELAVCKEECDRLNDENQFYGSMLGEIETVPGGSEILDTLFNKHK